MLTWFFTTCWWSLDSKQSKLYAKELDKIYHQKLGKQLDIISHLKKLN